MTPSPHSDTRTHSHMHSPLTGRQFWNQLQIKDAENGSLVFVCVRERKSDLLYSTFRFMKVDHGLTLWAYM